MLCKLRYTLPSQREFGRPVVSRRRRDHDHDGKVVSTSMRNIQQMMMSRLVEVAVAPKTSLLIAALRGFTWQNGGYSCSCLRLLSGDDALIVQSFDAWEYALLN